MQAPTTAPSHMAPAALLPPAHLERSRAAAARSLAYAVGMFELAVLGRAPTSVTIVAGGGRTTLMCTTPLTPMEHSLGATTAGHERVCHWHQSLALASFEAFREHIRDAAGITLHSLAISVDVACGVLTKTFATAGSTDLLQLDGQATGFGISVVDHWHVNDGDGSGSVRRQLFPEGLHNLKKVRDAGIDAEEP
jgi:hypothetical protein